MKAILARCTLLTILTAVAIGCGPKYDDCTLACGELADTCPTGMMCSNGLCTNATVCAPRGDADTDADAGAGGDAPMPDTNGHDGGPPDETDTGSPGGHDASDASDGPDGGDANDASDGPDGGEVAPPWTPGVIPNLVLWLEADRGISAAPGTKMMEWRDQSPLHNDARQNLPLYAPKLAADPFEGMPGVEFSVKSWMTITDEMSLRWGFRDFLVLVVYRATARCERAADCILQQLYRKQEVERPWRGPGLGIQSDGKLEVHLDHDAPNQWITTPAAGYDGGRIHLVGAQRRSSWPSLRIDGAEIRSGQPSAIINMDAPGANVYIGAHGLNPDPPVDFPFSGYIGAIVAVRDGISPADLAQLESYLMAKYGVVAAGPP